MDSETKTKPYLVVFIMSSYRYLQANISKKANYDE